MPYCFPRLCIRNSLAALVRVRPPLPPGSYGSPSCQNWQHNEQPGKSSFVVVCRSGLPQIKDCRCCLFINNFCIMFHYISFCIFVSAMCCLPPPPFILKSLRSWNALGVDVVVVQYAVAWTIMRWMSSASSEWPWKSVHLWDMAAGVYRLTRNCLRLLNAGDWTWKPEGESVETRQNSRKRCWCKWIKLP